MKAQLLRRAANVDEILVIVHPGSACGSADFNYGSRSTAEAERQGLQYEWNGWQGSVIVIDGDLSDELPSYPELNAALNGVLARAKAKGLISIRKYGNDPDQVRVIEAIVKRLKLDPNRVSFKCTGAWAYSETEGCVPSVCLALKGMGYKAHISDMALTGVWGPDEADDWDDEEDDEYDTQE